MNKHEPHDVNARPDGHPTEADEARRDRAWILRAQSGDVEAAEHLLSAYKPLVKRGVGDFFIQGGDEDDVLQEGMIALYKAIFAYRLDQGVRFATFAATCIRNHILDRVADAGRLKHHSLNASVSLDDQTDAVWHQQAVPAQPDLLDALIAGELRADIDQFVQQHCTPLEGRVYVAYMATRDVQTVAQACQLSYKTVQNALYRLRKKIKAHVAHTFDT